MRIIVFIFLLFIVSCTANQRARNYGGKEIIELNPNEKLVNATWKEADLWLITTQMSPVDTPKTYTMREKSSYGVWNGEITIIEKR